MAPPTIKPLLCRFSLVPGKGMILDWEDMMQFSFGAAVFLSSMCLLAIVARISAHKGNFVLLRGEILPGLTGVLIVTGMTVGLMIMGFSGQAYFASAAMEAVVLVCFTLLSIVAIHRLVVQPASAPAR
jgi:hypothetical protein